MHQYWQVSLLMPLLVILSIFAMPSKAAGPCYKVSGNRPKTGLHIPIQEETNPPKTWHGALKEYDGDKIQVSFDYENTLSLLSVQMASHSYMYVIIFHYNLGLDDWIYLKGGDQCEGMANGETVGIPTMVFVARVSGS